MPFAKSITIVQLANALRSTKGTLLSHVIQGSPIHAMSILVVSEPFVNLTMETQYVRAQEEQLEIHLQNAVSIWEFGNKTH